MDSSVDQARRNKYRGSRWLVGEEAEVPTGRAVSPHARDGNSMATSLACCTSISLQNTPMADEMVGTLEVSGVSGSHRGQSPIRD